MKKILLVGGGGHCNSVIDTLMSANYDFGEIAIIDTRENYGKCVQGVRVIGTDDDLPDLFRQGYKYAFVTVGSVGNPQLRIQLYNMLISIGFEIPIIADKSSIVSRTADIASGVFIGKGVIINAGTAIGACSIINTGAVIEHDCNIGAFVHAAPGCTICGSVQVGNNTHIGANATVIQGVHIGNDVVIGAGSVVIRDVKDECTVVGNPGRVIR